MSLNLDEVEKINGEPEFALRVLKADGAVEEVNRAVTLTDLQGWVGGYIELVPCSNPALYLYINEEGALHNLPPNAEATKLVREDVLVSPGGIRGNVVVMRSGNE